MVKHLLAVGVLRQYCIEYRNYNILSVKHTADVFDTEMSVLTERRLSLVFFLFGALVECSQVQNGKSYNAFIYIYIYIYIYIC